jgi:hypothetical protein
MRSIANGNTIRFTNIHYKLIKAPEPMRAVCQALNMLMVAIGAMLGSAINNASYDWIRNDLNGVYLERTYFFIFGLGKFAKKKYWVFFRIVLKLLSF